MREEKAEEDSRRRAQLLALAASLVVALLAAACGSGTTMRIVNRTQVPVVLSADGSQILVGACAERTILLTDGWGHQGGKPELDAAPSGAPVLPLPPRTFWPSGEGSAQVVTAITSDYAGAKVAGTGMEQRIGGTGQFPADPASIDCSGSPPVPYGQ